MSILNTIGDDMPETWKEAVFWWEELSSAAGKRLKALHEKRRARKEETKLLQVEKQFSNSIYYSRSKRRHTHPCKQDSDSKDKKHLSRTK
jgi:hypothetical protein